MSIKDIRKHIESLCSHLTFDFEGKACGVDPLAPDQFDMWCGEDTMTAKSIDEVITVPFFNGQPLENIIDKIENIEM